MVRHLPCHLSVAVAVAMSTSKPLSPPCIALVGVDDCSLLAVRDRRLGDTTRLRRRQSCDVLAVTGGSPTDRAGRDLLICKPGRARLPASCLPSFGAVCRDWPRLGRELRFIQLLEKQARGGDCGRKGGMDGGRGERRWEDKRG